jgi:nitrite reductase/ring-hydroxylating ferredoxin subunit
VANQILVCKTSDLAPGEMKRVEHADQGLAVYNVDGTFYVTSDRCTHGLSNLSEGVLMGTEIECAMHFGTFDVTTGEPTGSPCSIALRTYKVEMRGDEVLVEVD